MSAFVPGDADQHTVSLGALVCFACRGLAVRPVRLHASWDQNDCGRVACRRCVVDWAAATAGGPHESVPCPWCRRPLPAGVWRGRGVEDALAARLLADLPVQCGECGTELAHSALREHETQSCPAVVLGDGPPADLAAVEDLWRACPAATRQVVARRWPDDVWDDVDAGGGAVPRHLLVRVPALVLPMCLAAWPEVRLPRVLRLAATEYGEEDPAPLRAELDAWLQRRPSPEALGRALDSLFGDGDPAPVPDWLPRTSEAVVPLLLARDASLGRGAVRLAVEHGCRGPRPAPPPEWFLAVAGHPACAPRDLARLWMRATQRPSSHPAAAALLAAYVQRCRQAGQWPVPRSPPCLAEFDEEGAAATAAGVEGDRACHQALVDGLVQLIQRLPAARRSGPRGWFGLPAGHHLADRAAARLVGALLARPTRGVWETHADLLVRVVLPMLLAAACTGVIPPLTPTMAMHLATHMPPKPTPVRTILGGMATVVDRSLYPGEVWQSTAWGLVALHGHLGGRPEQLPRPLLFTTTLVAGAPEEDVLCPAAVRRFLDEHPRDGGSVLLTLLLRQCAPTTEASVALAWQHPCLADAALGPTLLAAVTATGSRTLFGLDTLLRAALLAVRRSPPPRKRPRPGSGGGGGVPSLLAQIAKCWAQVAGEPSVATVCLLRELSDELRQSPWRGHPVQELLT